ncbi:MAG: FHA domain-containing protein [Pseudomonadota bacterium]
MATITHVDTGRVVFLEEHHSVGRAANSALRVGDALRYVSLHHALLYWTGAQWEFKDLASRNGSFLNDERVAPGKVHLLEVGMRIAFGKSENQWLVTDTAPPMTMVVPLGEGEPLLAENDLIAIPSAQDPSVTLYRSVDGSWVLEQDISVTPITNQQTFGFGGRTFKFCCVQGDSKTSLATATGLEVRHLTLEFSVSKDEEHVSLRARSGAQYLDLGERNYHYLLLTLARQRQKDASEGLQESSCGWVYQDDFAHDPAMAPQQLSVDVFRIRKQFAAAGVTDAASIIERRPRTKQLRIGAHRVSIVTV